MSARHGQDADFAVAAHTRITARNRERERQTETRLGLVALELGPS